MAANKCEPYKCHTAVALNEVMNYASDNNLIFMETSAKTPLNVHELFMTVGMFANLIKSVIFFPQKVTEILSKKIEAVDASFRSFCVIELIHSKKKILKFL